MRVELFNTHSFKASKLSRIRAHHYRSRYTKVAAHLLIGLSPGTLAVWNTRLPALPKAAFFLLRCTTRVVKLVMAQRKASYHDHLKPGVSPLL